MKVQSDSKHLNFTKVGFNAILLCLLLFLLNPVGATGDIYVAYDAGGVPHFSTQRHNDTFSLYWRSGESPAASSKPLVKGPLAQRRRQMTPLIEQAAKKHELDPDLLHAMIAIESSFNAKAVSPQGAVGAMQLIHGTAIDYGVSDRYDTQQNLAGASRYLKDLLTAYEGNLPLALAAYNAGKANVQRHGQRIPPFPETMLYVPRVLAKYEEYQRQRQALAE